MVRPNTAERVERKQEAQKNRHNRKSRVRTFRIGNNIFVRIFMAGRQWLPGQITDVLGRVNYRVQLECGRCQKCHQDHLSERMVDDRSDGIVPQVSQGTSDESLEFDATSAGDTGRQKTATEVLPPSPDTSAMAVPLSQPSTDSRSNNSGTTSASAKMSVADEAATSQCKRKQTQRYEAGLLLNFFMHSFAVALLCMYACIVFP